MEIASTHGNLFFWITSLTIFIVNNKEITLQLSPSFWSKGDIIRKSTECIVTNTMLLTNLCSTQMVNIEESLKYDEEFETKIMKLKFKVGPL